MTHRIRSFERQDLRFSLYVDIEGRYQWRLMAEDGYELGHSSEGYVTKADCVYAAKLVAGEIPIWIDGGLATQVRP